MSQYVISRHHGHDSHLAIVGEGRIYHFEAERFSGRKHEDRGIEPTHVRKCLENAGLSWDDIIAVVEPCASGTWAQKWPEVWRGYWHRVDEVIAGGVMYVPDDLNQRIGERPLYRVSHHFSHGAYAFLTSPFPSASIMTMDGGGDAMSRSGEPGWNMCCTAGRGQSPFLQGDLSQVSLDHVRDAEISTGAIWASLALTLTNNINDAGTVMALGTSSVDHPMKSDIQRLQQKTSAAFVRALGLGSHDAVVLGGGCALNGIASYNLLRTKVSSRLFVPPAVNDGGLGVGAALYVLHGLLGVPRRVYSSDTVAFSGWDDGVPLLSDETADRIAELIVQGKIVGVFQGRAESGPRALGHRSVLADPTDPFMRDKINRLKGRQPYRPVAPAMTKEFALEHFDVIDPGAYYFMTCICASLPTAVRLVPSGLHDDGTARLQIVTPESGLSGVLNGLVRRGRPPCVLNTSLNERGRAIVHSKDQAVQVAKNIGLSAIAIGDDLRCL